MLSGAKGFALIAGFGALVGLIVWLFFLAADDQAEWEAWCRSQEGHVVDTTDTSTVVTFTNGKPGVGVASNTTYYCLSADGRILDIR